MSNIQAAETWMNEMIEKMQGQGDAWFPVYYPEFTDNGQPIEGKEKFDGSIQMRGVDYGDEENDSAIIDISAPEELAQAICDLWNHALDHLGNVLDEYKHLSIAYQDMVERFDGVYMPDSTPIGKLEKLIAFYKKGVGAR